MRLLMEALWEKLQFWKQNQVKYKVNEDYRFLPSPDDGIEEKVTAIGILKGKYSGVLYHYEKARVKEEGAFARLIFNYHILYSPTIPLHELQRDEQFQTMMGDILTDLISDQDNEKIREYHSKEPYIQ